MELFASNADLGLLVLRLGLAVVFFVHGWPKINPNSEMGGVKGLTGFFKSAGIPLPAVGAWIVALLETVGSALLALGIAVQPLALAMAFSMLVAIVVVKLRMAKAPFSGQGGWELEFILLVAALALAFTGAGAYAIGLF